ncbi:hypothetical protein [Paraburkholderia franconis]|nr:hypothetical protein [Paraburkholderia franconis]
MKGAGSAPDGLAERVHARRNAGIVPLDMRGIPFAKQAERTT